MTFPNKLLVAAGLFVLGGAVALLGQRVLFADPAGGGGTALTASADDHYRRQLAAAEERCRTNLELALLQLVRLSEFRRFAQGGQDVSVVVVSSGGAPVSGGLELPRVLVDGRAREEWSSLGEKLAGFEGGVDSRVFAAFQEVRDFVDEHPMPPPTGSLRAISGSDWARSDVVDRWLARNKALASRADAVISELYEQP